MKHITTALAFSFGLVAFPTLGISQEAESPVTEEAVAESPLEAVLEVARVEQTQGDDGALVETLVPADTAVPGDILQYTGTYTNVSETPLVGLIANGPIPIGTRYVDESQSISVEGVFEVKIDDEDWQELPAFKTILDAEGNEQRVEAGPSDYDQLRWRLSAPLDAEANAKTVYRVRVNN